MGPPPTVILAGEGAFVDFAALPQGTCVGRCHGRKTARGSRGPLEAGTFLPRGGCRGDAAWLIRVQADKGPSVPCCQAEDGRAPARHGLGQLADHPCYLQGRESRHGGFLQERSAVLRAALWMGQLPDGRCWFAARLGGARRAAPERAPGDESWLREHSCFEACRQKGSREIDGSPPRWRRPGAK